jgi:hypothetical protein
MALWAHLQLCWQLCDRLTLKVPRTPRELWCRSLYILLPKWLFVVTRPYADFKHEAIGERLLATKGK